MRTTFLGVSFFAMGIASFGWWASRRRLLHRVDNWLMETHLMSVGVAHIAASTPEIELHLVIVWACYAVWRLATFSGEGDLGTPSAVTWGGAIYSMFKSGGSGHVAYFLLGAGGVHAGLVLKMYDTTGRGAWGTAAFHYATALGWTYFYSWSQTLPAGSLA